MKKENDKVKTTITIDKNIFKSLKKVAIDREISQNQLMNDYISEGLKNEEKPKNKIPEHLILNKDTYNPNHERHMKMAGIVKYGKPFSAVKLVREMREGGHDIL